MTIEFQLGVPFLPFEQLLAVLPANSKSLLPEAYQVHTVSCYTLVLHVQYVIFYLCHCAFSLAFLPLSFFIWYFYIKGVFIIKESLVYIHVLYLHVFIIS